MIQALSGHYGPGSVRLHIVTHASQNCVCRRHVHIAALQCNSNNNDLCAKLTTCPSYYICPLSSMFAKPILLLPLQQVQHLINQINNAFGIEMECPPDPFTVSFFDDGTPQPKLLGTSTSRDDVSGLEASIPPASDSYGDDLDEKQKVVVDEASTSGKIAKHPTDRSLEAFKAKVERIVTGTKKSKAVAKKKKDHERLLRQEDWAKSVKRAQRYLGLRPKLNTILTSQMASTTSWSDAQQLQQDFFKKSGAILDPIDVNIAAPFPFDQEVIIISIDVEAYERDHRKVTEVGVSTLDTLDLVDIPPGEGGQNWIDQIRSRHFRVRERSHLVNKEFCGGDGNAFAFGNSEWVSLSDDEAAQAVDKCFEYPFSAAYKQAPEMSANGENEKPVNGATINVEGVEIPGPNSNIAQHTANQKAANHILETRATAQKVPKTRSIILIGHDLENDVRYLRDLGCSTFAASLGASATYPIAAMGTGKRAIIHDFLDTAIMYRVLVKETQNQSLTRVMAALDRTAWHLHNAGNDARYTLEAFLGIALKERKTSDAAQKKRAESGKMAESADKQWKDEVERRVKEKRVQAEDEVRKECEGWDRVTAPPMMQSESWGAEDSEREDQPENEQKWADEQKAWSTNGKYELIDGGDADPAAVQRVLEGKKAKERQQPIPSREFEEGKEPLSEEWSTAEWQT